MIYVMDTCILFLGEINYIPFFFLEQLAVNESNLIVTLKVVRCIQPRRTRTTVPLSDTMYYFLI